MSTRKYQSLVFYAQSTTTVTSMRLTEETVVCWLLACLSSQQQASVSQGRICSHRPVYLRDGSAHTGQCISGTDLLTQASVSQGRICSHRPVYLRDGSAHTGQCISGTDLLTQASVSQGRICSHRPVYLRDGSAHTGQCISGTDCSHRPVYLRDGSAQTSFSCCHTETEVADHAFYLTQSQCADTWPTSPSTDTTTPGARQGSHWSAKF